MVSHALEYVAIFPDEEVMEIKIGQPFELLTNRRRYTAKKTGLDLTREGFIKVDNNHRTNIPGILSIINPPQ